MALALMRRHRRWLYVFLWLVIAAFIILYIPALQDEHAGTPGETIVSVGGRSISAGEFQRDYFRQRQEIARYYQGRLDDAMIRQVQQQTLESLVTERLIELEAARLNVTVSDEAIREAVPLLPEYQADGGFVGAEEVRRRLALEGKSEEQFAAELRRRLLAANLARLVGSSAGVSDAEVERELARRGERVKLEYVAVDASRFRAGIEPSDEAIRQRFEAQKETYRIPEKRVASYILLGRETLRPFVDVSDAEIAAYYQDRREDFRQEEEACASHILVKVKQGEQGEGHTDDEAKTLAQNLLEQVTAGGDFAAIARKSSEDQGSAQNGGDLGCFPSGKMVSEFDAAVFDTLQPGQTSDLVKTSFGYHIIRLASKRGAQVPPLAQLKEQIRGLVLERKLSDEGDRKAQAIADALKRGKSLEEAAKAEGLSVAKSAPFARGEVLPDLAAPTVAARLFTMKQGEVEKEAFSTSRGAVFVALAEIQPPRVPDLAEVRDKVRAELVDSEALEQARALAASVASKAEGAGLEKAAAGAGLVRKETALVGRGEPLADLGSGLALEEAAYALPEKQLSGPVRTASGWAVLRVLEKQTTAPAELDKQRPQVRASLENQGQNEAFRAFLREARERYTITRNPAAYRRALGTGE